MSSPGPARDPSHEPGPVPEPELVRDEQWQRLDLRMLLVHPVRELIRFLPALVALFLAGGGGGGGGGGPWELIGVGLPVGLGLLRYLTTTFRIADDRIELRRGLLSRHVLSTPVDRVRTVDLTSSLIHRLLGLTKVRIGTGNTSGDDEERLDLDGLPLTRARELRLELLHLAGPSDTPVAPTPDRAVMRLEPGWARYAPFTGSGLVIGAAALGGLAQLLNATGGFRRLDPDRIRHDASGVLSLPAWTIGLLILLLVVVVVSLLSIAGYLATNWDFRLTRVEASGRATWQLRRGLFTTRETTLDEERVAGVVVGEPLGLRLVRGSRLSAIVTGLDRRQRSSALLVPPAPRGVVERTAAEVLGRAGPVTSPLLRHGPRAVLRRWTRAVVPALLLALAALVLVVTTGVGDWLLLVLVVVPVAALLAADRSRAMGHALVDGCLVARKGSLDRHREMLETQHVIGWNFRATWFQRRAGLTSLAATTAGGAQSVTVLDIPEDAAVALAAEALPALLTQFTREPPGHGAA